MCEHWLLGPFGSGTAVAIAGEGAPLTSEVAVAEFAAVLGLSTEAGKRLVGDVLELAFRLRRCWAKVTADEVPGWRARQVAELTKALSPAAARYVDAHDFDTAVATGAEQLKALGSADTLDGRRASAVGEMSRSQLALTFHQTPNSSQPTPSKRLQRRMTLYVHLSASAITGSAATCRQCGDPLEVARVESAHNTLLTADQIQPWSPSSAGGSTGQTCTCNLAALCRTHHRYRAPPTMTPPRTPARQATSGDIVLPPLGDRGHGVNRHAPRLVGAGAEDLDSAPCQPRSGILSGPTSWWERDSSPVP